MQVSHVAEIFDLEEVFKLLDVSAKRWGSGLESNWVFRGHGKSSWRLQPSARRNGSPHEAIRAIIARDQQRIQAALATTEASSDELDTRKVELFRQVYAEYTAVTEYIEFADRLALDPPFFNEVNAQTALMLARRAIIGEPLQGLGKDEAFAQHYQIPTCLLDWTFDPLVALFFAATDSEASETFSIFALDAESLRRRGEYFAIRLVEPFRESNSFMRAQSGLFTLDTTSNDHFLKNGAWPSLDETLQTKMRDHDGYVLQEFRIQGSFRDSILRSLWRMRISRAFLMPTLQNASKDIVQKWKWQADRPNDCGNRA